MNRKRLKIVTVIVLLGIMLCAAAYAKKNKEKSEQPSQTNATETERKVTEAEVPAVVLKAARKAAGSGSELTLERKTTILYEIKFKKAGVEQELLLTPSGDEVEQDAQKGQSDGDEGDDEDD